MREADLATTWRREMGKGLAQYALLQMLASPKYGYEIVKTMQDSAIPGATEANVYTLLKRLEHEGHLTSQWRPTGTGAPPRKYYQISATGARLLKVLDETWTDLAGTMQDWKRRHAHGRKQEGKD